MLQILSSPLIRQYAVVITVNLCVVTLGLGLAWPSPVLVKLRNETETVLTLPMTEEQGSWIVSIGSLVSAFANFLPAFLVDRIGRKYCIILACVPKLLACLLFTFATRFWMLLLGRGLNGIAECFVFVVVPMYASEIASKDVRGSLGTILQICSSLGILIMLSMGPFISYFSLNVIFTSATILTTIPIFFLPDSPYFLYCKGRSSESIKVLTFLRVSETLAKEELKEYSLTNTEVKINIQQQFKDKIFLKTVAIVIVLGAGGQLIGFNAISFYLQTILQSTRTSIKDETASVIIGCIQLVASVCTMFVTDRFGRKPILSVTLIGMAIGMIGLGAFFKVRENENSISGFMNFLPIVSLILVVFCFSAGFGSLNWMLTTELFDGPARAIGVSISIATATIFIFLTTKFFPMLTTALGPATTYWIFGVNCVLLCLFIMFCVPETKGRTFAEIQVALGADGLNLEKVEGQKGNDESGL